MKEIYRFEIGEEDKKRHFLVSKPTRKQAEEAETIYAVEMSKCIRMGILTKNMLAKKYADTGGVLSEEMAKNLSGYYHELNVLTSEFTRLTTTKNKTKKVKEQLKKIEADLVDVRRKIVDIESANYSLFNQTAEAKAQNRVITWYALNLTHEEIGGEWKPYFEGEDFDEKQEIYYEKEDSSDEQYHEMITVVGTVVAFWFFNQGLEQEEFTPLLEEFLHQEGDEEEVEAPNEDGG
jgi:hypothetical protein